MGRIETLTNEEVCSFADLKMGLVLMSLVIMPYGVYLAQHSASFSVLCMCAFASTNSSIVKYTLIVASRL